jgi:hypothetical protein
LCACILSVWTLSTRSFLYCYNSYACVANMIAESNWGHH